MAEDDETLVWYFTFGGNMNRATLARREGISPVQSLPGTLEGFQLAFNTQGFDGCEPRFASIEPLDPVRGVRVHGIAHRLTLRELRILDKYEGAAGPPGGTLSSGQRVMIAYNRVMANFTPYASAAADAPAASYEVHTYIATQAKLVEAAPPSRRYLDLIISGAAAIGLDETYLDWLRGHEAFCADGMAMPAVPEGAKARTVAFDELAAHSYADSHAALVEDGNDQRGAWVAMGGQCFDATSLADEKTMIRNMCGQDGTAFVLRMRDAAYGDGVPARLSELSAAQARRDSSIPTLVPTPTPTLALTLVG